MGAQGTMVSVELSVSTRTTASAPTSLPRLSAVSGLPTAPLPTVAAMQSTTALPAVAAMQSATALPAVAAMQSTTALPAVAPVQSTATLPTLAQLQSTTAAKLSICAELLPSAATTGTATATLLLPRAIWRYSLQYCSPTR